MVIILKTKIQKKLKIYLIFLLILSILVIGYSLLVYYRKIDTSTKSFNNITFIIGVISFFVLGLLAGNLAPKNGLLEGLISSSIILLLVLICNFFVKVPFGFKSIIKTISYITSASLGGVIGVNIKQFV